jgi:mRNA interferase HigB
MHVISRQALQECWRRHPDSKTALLTWFRQAQAASWIAPDEVVRDNPNARIIGNNRVIFNIMKNRYRLVVRIEYGRGKIFVRFVGTHGEYDKINAETV